MKQLKHPLIYLQWIMIFFSAIAFLLAILEGFGLPIEISSNGFKRFLDLFEPYSILFAATFVVITSQLAIERLGIMTDANRTAFKATNRTNWLQIVREFLTEIKAENPYMAKDITKQLLAIHDYLFDRQYNIKNKEEAVLFFNKFFNSRVGFYEDMNETYMNIACYSDKQQSYTWDAFRYIILVMLEDFYPRFVQDLREIYQSEVIKNRQQIIDKEMFELASKEYYKFKIQAKQTKQD